MPAPSGDRLFLFVATSTPSGCVLGMSLAGAAPNAAAPERQSKPVDNAKPPPPRASHGVPVSAPCPASPALAPAPTGATAAPVPTPPMRALAVGKVAARWLGLSTLAFALVLGTELDAHAWSVQPLASLLYVATLALLASAAGSVIVALGHGTFHALERAFANQPGRAQLGTWALLAVAVLRPINTLSGTLVKGAAISQNPHVRAVRVGIFVVLLLGWLLLWLWHAFGASRAVRERLLALTGPRWKRAADAAFWLAGAAALPTVFVLLGGLLRPYQPMADALLFPCWLIASTLLFRTVGGHARLGMAAATGALIGALVASAVTLHDERSVIAPHSAGAASSGFVGLTEGALQPFGRGVRADLDFAATHAPPCAPRAPQPAHLLLQPAQRRNVILLSIDTMRRDALGKRFGKRSVAPNLEAFARESIFFERASSAAPITLYSIGSVLTGHSVNQLLWLSSVPKTVFTRTKRAFDTQRITWPDWPILKRRGISVLLRQHTHVDFIDRKKDPTGPFIETLEKARAHEQRGFFWLHLVDSHAPYSTKKGFDFGRDKAAQYYSEVAFDDARVGHVLDYLRASGYFEDSLIIVFSDHGESLGEEGYWGHGISMRGRFTDVPLLVRYPGVHPRTSQAPAILSDIAPTILHFLNLPIPASVAGCSLLQPEGVLSKCPLPVSSVYGIGTETFGEILDAPTKTLADLERRSKQLAHWRRFTPEIAVTSSDRRYILDPTTGTELLFDRRSDPREKHNLVIDDPARVASFRSRIAQWRKQEAQRIRCDLPR